jgi:hypothetical protein
MVSLTEADLMISKDVNVGHLETGAIRCGDQGELQNPVSF